MKLRGALIIAALLGLGMSAPAPATHIHSWSLTFAKSWTCSGGQHCTTTCTTRRCACGASEDRGCATGCVASKKCE